MSPTIPSPADVGASDPHLARALEVLARTPLVDGHNDLPWAVREWAGAADPLAVDLRSGTPGCTDLERLARGRVGAQFWAIYVPCSLAGPGAARAVLEQIALTRAIIAAHPDALGEARTADDVERVFGQGRIASLLGMEGGHGIEGSLGALRAFFDLGVRYLTLTHDCTTEWADAARDAPRHGGLSPFGVEVVREMNRLGMMVDLSHTAPDTMHAALDASEAPVIWSHSGARGVVDHPRNVPDDVLRRVPDNGGVVMVTFVPSFVSEWHYGWDEMETERRRALKALYGGDHVRVDAELEAWRADTYMPPATLPDVADHIEHVRDVAGVEHVGIGSDFDGSVRVVEGLEDVSRYPALFAELARRGWSDDELAALAGRNVLRVMRGVEAVARG